MQKDILDEVYDFLGINVIYPSEHARVAHTLWITGSYFLEYEDIPVFDNFPILAFLSPDEDSGKSRALDVTETLAYNAINGGSYTAASLCREIDQRSPVMITMILDELDEILVSGKDNSDYIRLLNNGYQRGKYIVRASLTDDGENRKTMAYCPKAIAGLTTTKLKKTTRSRMLTIRMRPMRTGEDVELHIDKEKGRTIAEHILEWRPQVLELLKNIDERRLSSLINRSRQIWNPLLAIASVSGDDWLKRANAAAQYFIGKHKPEDNLGKKLLKELYRCYCQPKYLKGIWSETFAEEVQKHGFETDKYKIAYYLGTNGYGIETEQMRQGSENRNGYVWEACMPFFVDHLKDEEREEIHKEMAAFIPVPLQTSTGSTMAGVEVVANSRGNGIKPNLSW